MVNKKSAKHKQSHTKSQKSTPRFSSRFIVIVVITLTVLLVCFFTIFAFLNSPDRITKAQISNLANTYYEDIYYESLVSAPEYAGDPSKPLQKYAEYGLSPISLQQLILSNNIIDQPDADYLLKYCDATATTATIYPDPPYTRDSYHVEFNYSCNF